MENFNINRIEKIFSCAIVSVSALKSTAETLCRLFSILSKNNIEPIFIMENVSIEDNHANIGFAVRDTDKEKVKFLLDEIFIDGNFNIRENVTIIAISGAGLYRNPSVTAGIFGSLYESGIDIHLISTAEIKIYVAVDEEKDDEAIKAIWRMLENICE